MLDQNIAAIHGFNFASGSDHFGLWFAVTGINATVQAATLSSSALAAAFGSNLSPHHAALVDVGASVYLVIDSDGRVGYNSDDLMFNVTGATNLSSLSVHDFSGGVGPGLGSWLVIRCGPETPGRI